LKAAPQRPPVFRFPDEVDVVALHGILANTKAKTFAALDERCVNQPK
jgi:hypothetical protein